MAGTSEGSKKAVAKILARDPDHYSKIGRKGGKSSTTGGFFANRELARTAGRKGGLVSKRSRKTETSEEAELRRGLDKVVRDEFKF